MQRLLLAAGLLAFALLPARGDDGPKKEEKPATFADLQKEFIGKFRGAKDDDGRGKVIDEYAPKFQKAAEAAKAADAPPVISFLMQMAIIGKKAELRKTVVSMIEKDHLKTKTAGAFLGVLASMADEGNIALLGKILADNPEKKIQAKAAKALNRANESLAKLAKNVKDNERVKESMTKQRGEAFVKFLVDNEEKFTENAKKYKDMVDAKFKGVFPDLSIGKAMPEAVSKDLDGKEVKLSAYKGKVIVVDIWATWCPPCVAMIPHERELVKKMKDKPFVLISVSADDSPETVKKFMKEKGREMPWVHWHEGPGGDIISDWEVQYYPTIYVIDHKGIIRFKDVRDKKMDEAVEKLLKELEDEKGSE